MSFTKWHRPSEESFKTRFCRWQGRDENDYADRCFRLTLHRHARLLRSLLQRYDPDFFREDTDFIRELATTVTEGELYSELNRFHGRNQRDRSWLRKRLCLRVSATRALRILSAIERWEERHPGTSRLPESPNV